MNNDLAHPILKLTKKICKKNYIFLEFFAKCWQKYFILLIAMKCFDLLPHWDYIIKIYPMFLITTIDIYQMFLIFKFYFAFTYHLKHKQHLDLFLLLQNLEVEHAVNQIAVCRHHTIQHLKPASKKSAQAANESNDE